jgi:hypothetical protein
MLMQGALGRDEFSRAEAYAGLIEVAGRYGRIPSVLPGAEAVASGDAGGR